MDTFLGLSSTVWTGIYTILTFLLLVTAWIAARIAWGQWNASRTAVEDARKAQAEASRPYVLVTAEQTVATRTCFDLSIRNVGRRPAFEVTVKMDPAPKAALDTAEYAVAQLKMLTEPIAMIAPDQELRALWDSHYQRTGKDDLPTSHHVSLSYKDSSGREYKEETVIDLDAMKGGTYIEAKTLHDVGKSLEEIKKVLRGSSLLSSHGRIEVEAITETREANEERELRERHANLRRTIDSSKAWTGSDPKQTADMEAKLAALEEAHPQLAHPVDAE